MKFPEDVAVGVGIYDLSLRLECGKQYAFVLPEDCVTLIFYLAGDAGCFHCIDARFVSGW
jgi:hypothetical protein